MTTESLSGLVGMRICDLVYVHDYYQIVFDGCCLNVYMPMEVRRSGIRCDLASGIGCKVALVTSDDSGIVIHLENEVSLLIGLNPCNQIGPEKLSMTTPNGSIVVWQ